MDDTVHGYDASADHVPEVMRFAEMFPTVPLQTLVREVIHAQNSVSVATRDRTEIINRMVTTRLELYYADRLPDDIGDHQR